MINLGFAPLRHGLHTPYAMGFTPNLKSSRAQETLTEKFSFKHCIIIKEV